MVTQAATLTPPINFVGLGLTKNSPEHSACQAAQDIKRSTQSNGGRLYIHEREIQERPEEAPRIFNGRGVLSDVCSPINFCFDFSRRDYSLFSRGHTTVINNPESSSKDDNAISTAGKIALAVVALSTLGLGTYILSTAAKEGEITQEYDDKMSSGLQSAIEKCDKLGTYIEKSQKILKNESRDRFYSTISAATLASAGAVLIAGVVNNSNSLAWKALIPSAASLCLHIYKCIYLDTSNKNLKLAREMDDLNIENVSIPRSGAGDAEGTYPYVDKALPNQGQVAGDSYGASQSNPPATNPAFNPVIGSNPPTAPLLPPQQYSGQAPAKGYPIPPGNHTPPPAGGYGKNPAHKYPPPPNDGHPPSVYGTTLDSHTQSSGSSEKEGLYNEKEFDPYAKATAPTGQPSTTFITSHNDGFNEDGSYDITDPEQVKIWTVAQNRGAAEKLNRKINR